eukprot:6471021-Amphidinium_carterae.1
MLGVRHPIWTLSPLLARIYLIFVRASAGGLRVLQQATDKLRAMTSYITEKYDAIEPEAFLKPYQVARTMLQDH